MLCGLQKNHWQGALGLSGPSRLPKVCVYILLKKLLFPWQRETLLFLALGISMWEGSAVISWSHYAGFVSWKDFFSSGNEDKTVREAWGLPQPVLHYPSTGRAIVHICIQGLPRVCLIATQSKSQPFLRVLTECLCWGHLGFWSQRKSLRKGTPLLFAEAVSVQPMGQPCSSCTITVMFLKKTGFLQKKPAPCWGRCAKLCLAAFCPCSLIHKKLFFFSPYTGVEWVHENGTY